ncbi:MAG: hypothetical protein RLZZ602_1543 [Pseudomonadota bacterium]|jgi:hypothetical protein
MTQAFFQSATEQRHVKALTLRDIQGNYRTALQQQQETLRQMIAFFKGDYLNLD